MGVVFFLLGEKGLAVLQSLTTTHTKIIRHVFVGRDKNVQHDFSEEIKTVCEKSEISHSVENASAFADDAILIAIGWRWMINKTAKQQLIIFHDSLLPKYRGFNPLVSALINGDAEVGATALWGGSEYDTGDIIAQQKLNINYPVKIKNAIALMGACYQQLAVALMDKIANNKPIEAYKQNEAGATYSLWRDKEDYFIDWNQPASIIRRMVDAVGFPYDGARFLLDGKEYILLAASEVEDVKIENRCAGKLIYKKADKPVIVCGSGLLRLDEVQDVNGSAVSFKGKFRIRLK